MVEGSNNAENMKRKFAERLVAMATKPNGMVNSNLLIAMLGVDFETFIAAKEEAEEQQTNSLSFGQLAALSTMETVKEKRELDSEDEEHLAAKRARWEEMDARKARNLRRRGGRR